MLLKNCSMYHNFNFSLIHFFFPHSTLHCTALQCTAMQCTALLISVHCSKPQKKRKSNFSFAVTTKGREWKWEEINRNVKKIASFFFLFDTYIDVFNWFFMFSCCFFYHLICLQNQIFNQLHRTVDSAVVRKICSLNSKDWCWWCWWQW